MELAQNAPALILEEAGLGLLFYCLTMGGN